MKAHRLLAGAWAIATSLALADDRNQQAQPEVASSVVRVRAVLRPPHLLQPWRRQPPIEVAGSGVVIDGQRILCCAHLTLYASEVEVQPDRSSKWYPACVTAAAAEVDLALISIDDEEFFRSHPPLPIASGLPAINERLQLYGYGAGGHTLKQTAAIVSRIEYADILRLELNAPAAPGSSGGPAVHQGRVAGVVFGTSQVAPNVAYVISGEEILAFLDDIRDGRYDGKPRVWANVQAFDNPALRARFDLDDSVTGVLVSRSPRRADDPLQRGDILTHLGDYRIENDGSVLLADQGLRVGFRYLIPKLSNDGAVPATVVRQGQTRTVALPTAREYGAVLQHVDGGEPSYFIWGPLVFSTASIELVEVLSPQLSEWWAVQASPLITRQADLTRFPGERLVVVTGQFPHPTMKGYLDPTGQTVQEVNGIAVRNLQHLYELLHDGDSRFVELQFAERSVETLVFDRRQVAQAAEQILDENGIRHAVSKEMRIP